MDWLVRWHLVYDVQLSLPGHTISHNQVFNLYQELLLVEMSSQNKKAGTYPNHRICTVILPLRFANISPQCVVPLQKTHVARQLALQTGPAEGLLRALVPLKPCSLMKVRVDSPICYMLPIKSKVDQEELYFVLCEL